MTRRRAVSDWAARQWHQDEVRRWAEAWGLWRQLTGLWDEEEKRTIQ